MVARRTLKPSVRYLSSHLSAGGGATYLDVETLVAAPGVVAPTVPPVTRSLGLTLINILAGPSVGRNPRDDDPALHHVQELTLTYLYP